MADLHNLNPTLHLGQRLSAVRILESLGYSFFGSEWRQPSTGDANLAPEADELHALLVAILDGGGEVTLGEDELRMIADALEAYELKRWPDGS